MIAVRLDPVEALRVAIVGAQRQLGSIYAGRQPGYRFRGDPWAANIEGAAGEYAAAKALGIHWPGHVDVFDRVPDLAPQPWDVRTAAPGRRLIVHPEDPDDRLSILVLGSMPEYQVIGYLRNADAKQSRWWDEPAQGRPAAYYVPPDQLRPSNARP